MQIGIITSAMDANRAGIGSYTYNLVTNLLNIDKENEYTLIHKTNQDIEDNVYKMAEELRIQYPNIPLKETIGNNILIPLELKNQRFDIVHDPAQISPFLINLPAKKILTIHDLTPILFPETFGRIHSFLQNHILPRTLHKVDIIITVSQNTKEDIIDYLDVPEEKIIVTHLGVDDKFKPLNDTGNINEKYGIDCPFILYVGTLEPRKNIPTLIKAFYKLKREGIQHKLVIAGKKGWKFQEIYATIEHLGLQNEVIFTGYAPAEDLPKLYNAADVFVYPSLYEGFGLPPLEAMACGCPVITSNTSSLPEVVGDAGIMVNPTDPKALSDTICNVLSNESLKQEMIKKGLTRSKLFTWEKCAEKTIETYNKSNRL